MVFQVINFVLISCLLLFPVSASEGGGFLDGSYSVLTADTAASETSAALQEDDLVAALSVADGDLAGGFYFVCDCALGSDLIFYVPIEWAYDAFTTDSSGSLVNLSTTTCYAYCPDYPDYTFTCSRFNTFTYRSTGYDTSDLQIRDISDTNISLLDANTITLPDKDLLLLIGALIFAVAALLVVRRA